MKDILTVLVMTLAMLVGGFVLSIFWWWLWPLTLILTFFYMMHFIIRRYMEGK